MYHYKTKLEYFLYHFTPAPRPNFLSVPSLNKTTHRIFRRLRNLASSTSRSFENTTARTRSCQIRLRTGRQQLYKHRRYLLVAASAFRTTSIPATEPNSVSKIRVIRRRQIRLYVYVICIYAPYTYPIATEAIRS